jgi:cyclophilin family peptidyl-prolyl cis-trans isomerase
MKRKYHIISVITFLLSVNSYILHSQTPMYTILISTSMGDMKAVLYSETPIHSENFAELVKKGFYNGLTFHRVIKNFMIQTGDPRTRKLDDPSMKTIPDVDYTLPAEFNPALYHRKAVIAAARMDDSVNPMRESSGSQFYIVQGRKFTDKELDQMVDRQVHIKFTDEQRNVYKTLGGAPHLDYAYTVFGEVISGIEVIDKIASVPVDKNNRPLEDVRITIKLLK